MAEPKEGELIVYDYADSDASVDAWIGRDSAQLSQGQVVVAFETVGPRSIEAIGAGRNARTWPRRVLGDRNSLNYRELQFAPFHSNSSSNPGEAGERQLPIAIRSLAGDGR